MDQIMVKGRMLARPHVTTEAFPDGVRIRVDSQLYPDQWVELWITSEQLAELLGQVVVTRPSYEPEMLALLKVIGKVFPW